MESDNQKIIKATQQARRDVVLFLEKANYDSTVAACICYGYWEFIRIEKVKNRRKAVGNVLQLSTLGVISLSGIILAYQTWYLSVIFFIAYLLVILDFVLSEKVFNLPRISVREYLEEFYNGK